MAIEIVDFPMKNGDFPWQNVSSPEGSMVIFHSYVNVYQRVPLFHRYDRPLRNRFSKKILDESAFFAVKHLIPPIFFQSSYSFPTMWGPQDSVQLVYKSNVTMVSGISTYSSWGFS